MDFTVATFLGQITGASSGVCPTVSNWIRCTGAVTNWWAEH